MNCKKIKACLIKNGNLNELSHDEAIHQHLQSCTQCQSMIRRMEALTDTLHALSEEKIPLQIHGRLWPRVAQAIEQRRVKWYQSHTLWAVGIPSLATAAIVLILIIKLPPSPLLCPNHEGIVIENAKIDGEKARLSVSQGGETQSTMIWLD